MYILPVVIYVGANARKSIASVNTSLRIAVGIRWQLRKKHDDISGLERYNFIV